MMWYTVIKQYKSLYYNQYRNIYLFNICLTFPCRKPVQKEENLSEEARRVIAGLPDLSFMQAKVLMFPSTLTPLLPSSSPSPTPD